MQYTLASIRTNQLAPILALLASIGIGCADASAGTEEGGAAASEVPTAVVDSVLPIEEEIRRFREGMDRRTTALTGGADSRDALVAAFVAALESSDTAAIASMVLDRAEFIDLYYPHTVYTRAPYELSPGTVWFQMTNNTSRGLSRAFRQFAGRPLHYEGHACRETPTIEGPNRVWERCVVRIAPDGEPTELRLFGLIVEREGAFKFVTYGNDL